MTDCAPPCAWMGIEVGRQRRRHHGVLLEVMPCSDSGGGVMLLLLLLESESLLLQQEKVLLLGGGELLRSLQRVQLRLLQGVHLRLALQLQELLLAHLAVVVRRVVRRLCADPGARGGPRHRYGGPSSRPGPSRRTSCDSRIRARGRAPRGRCSRVHGAYLGAQYCSCPSERDDRCRGRLPDAEDDPPRPAPASSSSSAAAVDSSCVDVRLRVSPTPGRCAAASSPSAVAGCPPSRCDRVVEGLAPDG